jgi:hypothetical protein
MYTWTLNEYGLKILLDGEEVLWIDTEELYSAEDAIMDTWNE